MARRRSTRQGPADFDYRPLVNAFQRLDRRMQVVVLIGVAILGIIAFFYYRSLPPHEPPQTQRDDAGGPPPAVYPIAMSPESHVLLGIPDGAVADANVRDRYLMLKPFYAVSYNEPAGVPNWVSWRLTRYDAMGNAERKQSFDADDALPPGFRRVTHKDYSGSGFDRGHLCPHADRDFSKEMAWSTFVMSNIIPQAPNLNQKAWNQFENYCRMLANKQNKRLYVTAGGVGRGGRGTAGLKQVIADGKVTVPAECWKVVVAIPEDDGTDDAGKVDASARVIAVLMPNDDAKVDYAWAGFRVSPAEIEGRTGYRFFDRLRPDVADALRQRVDREYVPPPEPREEVTAGDEGESGTGGVAPSARVVSR